MAPQTVSATTEIGCEGVFRVDVPLDPPTLLPRLHDIGIWLVEWQIPHQARVSMQPQNDRLRISCPEQRYAHAFHMQFGGQVVEE